MYVWGLVTTTTTTSMFLATAMATETKKKGVERRIEFWTKRIMVILSGILRPWVFLQSMNTHRRVFPVVCECSYMCQAIFVFKHKNTETGNYRFVSASVTLSSRFWIFQSDFDRIKSDFFHLKNLRQSTLRWSWACFGGDWTCVVTIDILRSGVEKGSRPRQRVGEGHREKVVPTICFISFLDVIIPFV